MTTPAIDRKTLEEADTDLLADFADTRPATFERERRGFAGAFEIYADRKAKAFVMLSSGLSHSGGRIQHILTIEEAEKLGRALLCAAEFSRVPMMGDKTEIAKASP